MWRGVGLLSTAGIYTALRPNHVPYSIRHPPPFSTQLVPRLAKVPHGRWACYKCEELLAARCESAKPTERAAYVRENLGRYVFERARARARAAAARAAGGGGQ